MTTTALDAFRTARPPRFLVTGTGRSGSKWIAQVLTEAGIATGHEAWWSLHRAPVSGLVGEASWLGCFDDGYVGSVFVQVRDPRTAIPSIYSNEYHQPYFLIRQQNVPLSGDWAVDACRIWLHYNTHALNKCEAAWRLEDVDAATLAEIFAPWGGTTARFASAMQSVPRTVNARPKQGFAWPEDPIVEECLTLAKALGYEI